MSRPAPTPSLRRPPEDCTGLSRFPRKTISETTALWRVTRKGREPWFFASGMEGRFDLPDPEGTCYLGFDPLAALLEVLAGSAIVSTTFLEDRRIRKLALPEARTAADMTSARAASYGITLEISTIVPYDIPQQWALCLSRAGRGGIVYFARHDPSAARSLALFGDSGARKRWRRGREERIAPELVEQLETDYGIRVAPIPDSSELDIR